jgi:demethylspheroidene O-methyltransferase
VFASLKERFLAWKARVLANPRFHRFATRSPFTRPVARREARALFDLCAGFVYTQVLRTFVELQLHTILARGPADVAALQAQLGLSGDAMRRLLVAAESLRLVVLTGPERSRVVLGDLGAALLANPGALAMIRHHAVLYEDLNDPVALLKGECTATGLRSYWDYEANAAAGSAGGGAMSQADYTALMEASQQLVADEVLDAWDFSRHRHVMDVGGGSGNFCLAAAARHPSLRLTLFDLPPVAARARERFEAHGLADRADAVGGSFLAGDLPDTGADLITLVRIVHDHDDAEAERLLRAAHRALAPGGTLLIAEPMAGTRGAEPMGGAYFGFYLLAMGQGRPRRPEELAGMLRRCGFGQVRNLATHIPLLTRAIVAKA